MKKWLSWFNREQITCGICFAFAGLLLLTGVAGGGAESRDLRAEATSLEYVSRPTVQFRPLESRFEDYWKGRNVFQTEGTSLLPVPPIEAVLPRLERPSWPFVRPHPVLEEINRQFSTLKPVVPETDLLPASDLSALLAVQEPPVLEFKDRSRESDGEFCLIFWNVQRPPTEGYCFQGCAHAEESGELVEFWSKDRKSKMQWKRSDIRELRHSWKNIDQFRYRAGKIKSGTVGRVQLARWCLERGMIAYAKESLAAALEENRDSADAVHLLGDVLEEEGDFDTAIAHYRATAEAAPSLGDEMHWRIGECLRKLGLTEAALESFRRSTQSPRYFKGRVSQARMWLDLGEARRAIEIIDDVLSSKFAGDSNLTSDLRLLAHTVRGRARLRLGNLSAALTDLEKSRSSPEALNMIGSCHAFEGRWREAALAFSAALRLDQYRISAWTNLGIVYGLAGRTAEAASLFQAAALRDPSDTNASACAALVLLLQGKAEEAGKQMDAAAALDPTSVYAGYLKGEFELRKGRGSDALMQFRAVLQREPDFIPAQVGLANACLRERQNAPENLARAEALYRALATAVPQRSDLQTSLGCTYALLARPEAARTCLNRAATLVREAGGGADPIVEYWFGYVHYRYGNADPKLRMEEASKQFKNTSEVKGYDDPASLLAIQEAGELVKKIEEWRRTSLSASDDFNRANSETVSSSGNRWEEQDRKPRGSVRISDQRCLFSGESTEDWIPTKLERDHLPIEEFHRLEVTFVPQPQSTVTYEFGVSMYASAQGAGSPRSGIHVGFDRQRRLRIGNIDEQTFDRDRREMAENWQTPNSKFVLPGEIRLRLERRIQNNVGMLEVQIYNPTKREYEKVCETPWTLPAMGGSKEGLKASFWARGWSKEKVGLTLDDVRIYEKRRRP